MIASKYAGRFVKGWTRVRVCKGCKKNFVSSGAKRFCNDCKEPFDIKQWQKEYSKKYRSTEEYRNHAKEYQRERRSNSLLKEKERGVRKLRRDVIREEFKKKAQQRFGFLCYVCGRRLEWDKFTLIHHRDGSNEHKGHALENPHLWDKCVAMCRRCHALAHVLTKINNNQLSHLLELRRDLLCHIVECLKEK